MKVTPTYIVYTVFCLWYISPVRGIFYVQLQLMNDFHFRDSIEPLFEAQEFLFSTHSVFLDSSNTPLPLAFDTFPLGGNTLHVRGRDVYWLFWDFCSNLLNGGSVVWINAQSIIGKGKKIVFLTIRSSEILKL